jgi:O-succinylbenzoate synthase
MNWDRWSSWLKELPAPEEKADMTLEIRKHTLQFHRPATTSRDTLLQRDAWFFILRGDRPDVIGIGECSPIFGLSLETPECLENAIAQVLEIQDIQAIPDSLLKQFPSIRFALEVAQRDLENGGTRVIFPNHTNERIPINGLVWMNDKETMMREAVEKIQAGFTCLKLKIGGIDFDQEVDILSGIRSRYNSGQLEIRLDANGSFSPENAMERLQRLSQFEIHSIEQPVRAGQWDKLAEIVAKSPIPIALDEELIPIIQQEQKNEMLDKVKPHYIILKPTLHGGIAGCDEWISLAESRGIRWWATSALESNIGLNAIAQWVSTYQNPLPQGLGTGQLYVNNIPSPLSSGSGYFWWDQTLNWHLETIVR